MRSEPLPSARRPTTQGEAYRWLEHLLGIKDLPPELIRYLTREGHFELALNQDFAGGPERLLEAARRWLKRNPQHDLRPRSRKIPKRPLSLEKLLGPGVCARAKLQNELALDVARAAPEVVEFRKNLLRGETLDMANASKLIMSDAAALLYPHDFWKEKIPIVGHEGQLCVADGGHTGVLTPDGFLEIKWSDKEWRVPLKPEWMQRHSLYDHNLAYPAPDLTPRHRFVYRGSVLDHLARAGKAVTSQLLWEEHEAVWFILTDTPLYDLALHGRVHARRATALTFGHIQLTIDAWVPASRVHAVYQAVQKQNFKVGRKSSQPRKFELYKLLAALKAATPNAPVDEAAMDAWNAGHRGKQKYRSLKLFKRDAARAEQWMARELVAPKWDLLEESSEPRQAGPKRQA